MDKRLAASENTAVHARQTAAAEIGDLLHRLRLPESRRKPPPQSLTAAAVGDDLDSVSAFLDAGASVEERSIGFASPLQAAAGAGRLAAVSLLLARGADPREKPDTIYSPLAAAAMHGHLEIVQRLAEAIGDLSGETKAAPHAATHGRLDTLEFLLDRGAPLGAHAGHVLRAAAWGGRFACVKRLLAEGIDPRHHPDYDRDLFGEPVDEPYLPRQAALDNGHTLVAELLDGLDVDEALARQQEAQRRDSPSALARLAKALGGSGKSRTEEPPALEGAERAEVVLKVLALVRGDPGGSLAGIRAGGRPALVAAAEGGHAAIVDALLEAGADPKAAADDGDTALIAAARWGHQDLVTRLLAQGADLEARNAERMTALMAAAARGDLACVRILLEAGADPEARVRGRSASGFAYGVHRPAIRALVAEYAARRATR
jgi:serine/threonine-protein phosphatase 6 regulatory ankyrin repeat subunit B